MLKRPLAARATLTKFTTSGVKEDRKIHCVVLGISEPKATMYGEMCRVTVLNTDGNDPEIGKIYVLNNNDVTISENGLSSIAEWVNDFSSDA